MNSNTHREAVEAVVTLPQTTQDIGEQLSRAHQEEKRNAREMLRVILSSVRFLARQGIAFRGSGDDSDSNLVQLLRLRAEDNPALLKWLEKKGNKHTHTSHDNQNEMLQIMARHVLMRVLKEISTSPFLSLMVDETTDVSNKEQLTLVIRRVDDDFAVFEEFVGLYTLASVDADSIVQAIKDTLLRLQIPTAKLRGQCYDGCNTMAGAKGGVAVKIQELEPKAVFTHCYGHALNLSVNDTMKKSTVMRDCLDTCYELVKLIKCSPKREAMLCQQKEETDSETLSLRALCPTRWTVRAESLARIISNYKDLLLLWETALATTSQTEMKARIHGVASQMQTFKFLFGILLAERILQHTDKLSKTLQNPQLSSTEGHAIAMLTVRTLSGIRTEENFDLFWASVDLRRQQLGVDEPQLPRRHKMPRRYDDGEQEEFPQTNKALYRRHFYEAIDLAIHSITDRFDQPGFKVYCNVEQLLLKACSGKDFSNQLSAVCDFFEGDFVSRDLDSELQTLKELYQQELQGEQPRISAIKKVLLSLTPAQRDLMSTACKLLQLLLVMPATNATSERTFSALRRIKTYLRSTMMQARLNHLMIMHYHQDGTDGLNLADVGNDYISANDSRLATFARFI